MTLRIITFMFNRPLRDDFTPSSRKPPIRIPNPLQHRSVAIFNYMISNTLYCNNNNRNKGNILDTKIVCTSCVSFPSLQKYIGEEGKIAVCSYCFKKNNYSVQTDKIFGYISSVLFETLVPLSSFSKLESFFYHADEELVTYSDSFDFLEQYENKFQTVFFNELVEKLNDEFDVHEPLILLKDSYRYEDDCYYVHSDRWRALVKRLNHEYRYSNGNILLFLEDVLSPILDNGLIKSKYIKTLPKDKLIYRGRIYNSEESKDRICNEPHK